MRLGYIATALLLIAIFALPTLVPIAQVAAAAVNSVEPAQINPGFTGRTLVIDPDQAASLVAITVLGSSFQPQAALQFEIFQGTNSIAGPYQFATSIGVYGGDGTAPLKLVQGGWVQSPSITMPPTLVADGVFPTTPGVYTLFVSDGTNSYNFDFRVLDIVAGSGFPQINNTDPSSVLTVNNVMPGSTSTQDVLPGIPVYEPGDTVGITITGLPAGVTNVRVYLDWIGSPYMGSVQPSGAVYAGSITLPSELPMGVHLILALIEFDLPVSGGTVEPAATIAVLPIYVKPKLVSGPFIIQGIAGETINVSAVGLPESTPVGRDYDGDGNVEALWAENEITGGGPFDFLGIQTLTSPLGSYSASVSLESDIPAAHRGALTLYMWDSMGTPLTGDDIYTLEWNGGIFPDMDALQEIRFPATVIASRPDVPPTSITYGDSGLAVFIDGQPFPDNQYLYPCLSSVRIIVFNTMANAQVQAFLGPFLIGQETTDSLGVAVIDVPPENLVVPGVSGTTQDYTFFAVANRATFFDNINFDTTDYVDIVPWGELSVDPAGFYYVDTNGIVWAGSGTQFITRVCGLEPHEDLQRNGTAVATANNLGVAEFIEQAPTIGSTGTSVSAAFTGANSGTVWDPNPGAAPTTQYSYSYNVPELLDIQFGYELYGSSPNTITVEYSTAQPGENLNSQPRNTILVVADNINFVPPGLTFTLDIGGGVQVTFTSSDFDVNVFTPSVAAPSATGIYYPSIQAAGFDFTEVTHDYSFLVVSDPLSLEPQIIQFHPDDNQVYALAGTVGFIAFNFTNSDTITVRSPTIVDPTAYPARFHVFDGITGAGTLTPSSGDAYQVQADDTGAAVFLVEDFLATATTHTLHMRGGIGGLFTFNVEVIPHLVVIPPPTSFGTANAGGSVTFGVIAHGAQSDGWYRLVLLDPVTLEPLFDLQGNGPFVSGPFQADQEGTIGLTTIAGAPLTESIVPLLVTMNASLYLPLGSAFIAGLEDVETGEIVALSGPIYVIEDSPYNLSISSYILTPLATIDMAIEDVDLNGTLPAGAIPTSLGATIEFYSIEDGSLLFETLAVGKTFIVSGETIDLATFLVPIPNFDSSLAGSYVLMRIGKIVVQYYDNANDDVGFLFALDTNGADPGVIDVGVVKLGADGGALVNLTAVLAELGVIQEDIDELMLAVNDGFATILLRLDNIEMTLAEISDGIAQLQTDVGMLQASIDDLAEMLGQAEENIVMTVTQEADRIIGEITNGIITLQGEHGQILDVLEGMGAALVAIQDGIAQLQTTAGTILVTVEDLQTLLGDATDLILQAIDDQTVVLTSGQSEIMVALDALQGTITEVAEGVATIETAIGEVQMGVEDLLELGAEISGVVAENNQLLVTITTSVGNMQADITALRDLIESGVSVQLEQVLQGLQAIAEQNAALADQASQIAQTLSDVKSQTDRITDIQSTVASVASDVAAVKQDTSEITTALEDTNATLSNIESKVDNISQAVADLQEAVGDVQSQAESASGRAQTWGIINTVLTLAVLGVAGYLVLQLTRRE